MLTIIYRQSGSIPLLSLKRTILNVLVFIVDIALKGEFSFSYGVSSTTYSLNWKAFCVSMFFSIMIKQVKISSINYYSSVFCNEVVFLNLH